MIVKEELIEALLLKAGDYGNTSMEILKLKALRQVAIISANLVSRGLLLIALTVAFVFLNIGLSLWLGEVLGKTYYGFLVVGFFYCIVSAIVFFLDTSVKKKISSSIITQMFN